MADFEDQDDKPVILNVAYQPIVADAKAPELAQARSGQGVTNRSWIVEESQAMIDEVDKSALFYTVQF